MVDVENGIKNWVQYDSMAPSSSDLYPLLVKLSFAWTTFWSDYSARLQNNVQAQKGNVNLHQQSIEKTETMETKSTTNKQQVRKRLSLCVAPVSPTQVQITLGW